MYKKFDGRRAMKEECLEALRAELVNSRLQVELATCADDRRWHTAQQHAIEHALRTITKISL
jgi:hypothetical protein